MGLDTTQAHDHPTSGRPSTGNVVLRLANDADAINEAAEGADDEWPVGEVQGWETEYWTEQAPAHNPLRKAR